MAIEIIRDQMSPRARAPRAGGHPGWRAVRDEPADRLRRGAILHAAAADLMSQMPHAEGVGLLVTNFQLLADRYQAMTAALPSTSEH